VLFFEVPDLAAAIDAIGRERLIASNLDQGERRWAVLHDPEQHNVVLFEAGSR
jgi:hypothetical protein